MAAQLDASRVRRRGRARRTGAALGSRRKDPRRCPRGIGWRVRRRPQNGSAAAFLRHNLIEWAAREFNPPIATAAPAVQSNVVYLPQEALHDFSRLGLAADKR
jgi:hypothetical protein